MMTINGVDVSTLGFYPRRRELSSLGGEQSSTVNIPGAVPIRTGGITVPGRLSVSGSLFVPVAGTQAADHQLVHDRVDSLAAALRGECVIRFDDYADREWVGRLQAGSLFSDFDPQWIARGGTVSLDFLCPDPRARAQAETTRTSSGSLVLGTAASPIRVEVTTAGTATVRVRSGGAAGTILTELVWTGASGALVIDGETGEVSVGGANAVGGLAAGYAFPIADPEDGADYVEVPAGATVRYRRRWL